MPAAVLVVLLLLGTSPALALSLDCKVIATHIGDRQVDTMVGDPFIYVFGSGKLKIMNPGGAKSQNLRCTSGSSSITCSGENQFVTYRPEQMKLVRSLHGGPLPKPLYLVHDCRPL